MDTETFPLMDLPPLVLVVVLGSLSAKDVAIASETCLGLYRLCQHNAVWKRVAKKKWGLKPSKGILRPARWKHYYNQCSVVLRPGTFKWEQLKTTGDTISKRYQHTGSAVGTDIYFIGGQELPERRFDEIFVLHTDTMKVEKVNPALGIPPKFARHTAVTVGDNIYLFGGFDGISKHFHLSMFNTKTLVWSNLNPAGSNPPSRTNHSAVAIGSRMYIFGGMYKDTSAGSDKLIFLNDMHVLDTDGPALTWTRVIQKGEIPSPRCGHRMVAFGHLLLLFGGGCGEQWDSKFSDVFVFDTTTNEWTKPKITGNAPVCTFTVTFAAGVFLFVFGGQSLNDNNLTNELYCLDTVSMQWHKLSADDKPGARDMASGNVVGSSMFMFGGYCGSAIDTLYKLQMDPKIADTQVSLPPRA